LTYACSVKSRVAGLACGALAPHHLLMDFSYITLLACLVLALRLGLGLMFAVGAIGKLRNRLKWNEMLAAYQLLPLATIAPVAVLMPLAELVVAGGLFAGLPLAGVAGAGLMLLFALAISINLLRGRTGLDCGCNPGARPQPIAWSLVVRNIVLAGLVAACALPMAPLPLELAVSAGVAGALGYGLVYILSMLRAMAPPEPFRGAR
jgi:hypothetical protein